MTQCKVSFNLILSEDNSLPKNVFRESRMVFQSVILY